MFNVELSEDARSRRLLDTNTGTHTVKMSRPTVTIIGADGAASQNTHPLPNVFKAPIRADIVQYENSDSNTTDQAGKNGIWANRRTGMSTPAWPRTSVSLTP
jgi:hypothetical protein